MYLSGNLIEVDSIIVLLEFASPFVDDESDNKRLVCINRLIMIKQNQCCNRQIIDSFWLPTTTKKQ